MLLEVGTRNSPLVGSAKVSTDVTGYEKTCSL